MGIDQGSIRGSPKRDRSPLGIGDPRSIPTLEQPTPLLNQPDVGLHINISMLLLDLDLDKGSIADEGLQTSDRSLYDVYQDQDLIIIFICV